MAELTIPEMIESFNQTQAAISAKYTELENLIDKKGEISQIEELKSEIKKISKDRVEQNDILIKQGTLLTKLSEKGPADIAPMTFQKLAKQIILENKDKFAALARKESKGFSIELDTKLISDANLTDGTFGLRVGGIGQIPYRRTIIEPLFSAANFGDNSGGNLKYVDQDVITDGSDMIANCSPIPESDVTWIERNLEAKKCGTNIPICIDTIENYDFVEAEVRNVLIRLLDQKLDSQLILGDGLVNNITGLDATAPDWVAGSFGLAIDNPSIYDVISTGVTQISVAGQENFYTANVTLMNAIDAEKMRLTKDANNNYILPPFGDIDSQPIRGTRVITNPVVPENEMYIGDFTYGTVYTLRGLTLDVTDSHGDNFLSDIIVIKGTWRKQLLIRNVHAGAFLHVPSISAAITALTKP